MIVHGKSTKTSQDRRITARGVARKLRGPRTANEDRSSRAGSCHCSSTCAGGGNTSTGMTGGRGGGCIGPVMSLSRKHASAGAGRARRQSEAGRRARAHCGPGGGTVWTAGPPFSYTVASSAVASRSYRITSVSSCSVAVAESSFVWRMTIFAGGPAAAPGALPAAQDRACARRAPTLPRRAARGPGPSSKLRLPGGRDSATAGKKKRHDVTGRDPSHEPVAIGISRRGAGDAGVPSPAVGEVLRLYPLNLTWVSSASLALRGAGARACAYFP
jgi:hypothetical protein